MVANDKLRIGCSLQMRQTKVKGIDDMAVTIEWKNGPQEEMITGPQLLDQITTPELLFSTTKLLPPYHVIPDPFMFGTTKWNRLFSDWFYSGVTDLHLVPKAGVDVNKALRVIKAHMISFEPSHGHKEAGVAYMMSMLFEDAEWSLHPAD